MTYPQSRQRELAHHFTVGERLPHSVDGIDAADGLAHDQLSVS